MFDLQDLLLAKIKDRNSYKEDSARLACLMIFKEFFETGCQNLFERIFNTDVYYGPQETIADLHWLRAMLEGTGVSLKCTCPPTHFCLIHETIGAEDHSWVISSSAVRPLTEEESLHAKSIRVLSEQMMAARLKSLPIGLEIKDESEDVTPVITPNIQAFRATIRDLIPRAYCQENHNIDPATPYHPRQHQPRCLGCMLLSLLDLTND